MTYTSILVQLDTGLRSPARLKFALQLARQHGAHLTGVLTSFTPDPRAFYVMAGYAEYFQEHRAQRLERQSTLAQVFHAELEQAGLNGRWVANIDYPNNDMTELARCADLVIAGQEDPDDPESFIADNFPETLVMAAGRPVLFHPCSGEFSSFGENAMIAWNGSRESVRAVHDALPMLRRATRTTIVMVDETGGMASGEQTSSADIALSLARHDVKAEVVSLEKTEHAHVGKLLLSQASKLNADLIVMGTYGHSRWQELVMGGVTRSMFQFMTVPVLMSH